MPQLFALYLEAIGYGLFEVREFDEIAAMKKAVEESVSDSAKFRRLVKLRSFQVRRRIRAGFPAHERRSSRARAGIPRAIRWAERERGPSAAPSTLLSAAPSTLPSPSLVRSRTTTR